jgi:hypothetical protein
MDSWAEAIARQHVQTREGRRNAESRALRVWPAWAVQETDAYPTVAPKVRGAAQVDSPPSGALVGRAGTLTIHQSARANWIRA